MTEAACNLSGLWQGQFSYPRLFEPEFFTATLLDQTGHISGCITEKANDPNHASGTFFAQVSGTHTGLEVYFKKYYEGAVRSHTVHYEGSVNEEGTEISGTWRIQGSWSGPFLMVRSAPETIRAVERVVESVV